jgi:hypothetical protein
MDTALQLQAASPLLANVQELQLLVVLQSVLMALVADVRNTPAREAILGTAVHNTGKLDDLDTQTIY